MKKISVLFFIFIMFISQLYSSNIYAPKIKKAEELYKKGDYKAALEIYRRLENKSGNYKFYYNMGNTYFKLKNYPMAKVYYLRAYKLKQNDKDLNHNIKIVELHLTDKIKIPEPDPFTKILNNLKNSLTINQFFILTLFILILLSIVFTFYKGKKKTTIIVIEFIFLIVLSLFDIAKFNDFNKKTYVLLKDKIAVKSEPTDNSVSVFTIHSGIDFIIKDNLSGWYLIVLKNGYRGWVKLENKKDFIKI